MVKLIHLCYNILNLGMKLVSTGMWRSEKRAVRQMTLNRQLNLNANDNNQLAYAA